MKHPLILTLTLIMICHGSGYTSEIDRVVDTIGEGIRSDTIPLPVYNSDNSVFTIHAIHVHKIREDLSALSQMVPIYDSLYSVKVDQTIRQREIIDNCTKLKNLMQANASGFAQRLHELQLSMSAVDSIHNVEIKELLAIDKRKDRKLKTMKLSNRIFQGSTLAAIAAIVTMVLIK